MANVEGKGIPIDGFAFAKVIAAGALCLATLRWPHSYYTILRWTVCIIGVYAAFRALSSNNKTWAWIFVGLAVLFNPIAPIYFARKTWNLLDVLAAVVLLVSLAVPRNRGGTSV